MTEPRKSTRAKVHADAAADAAKEATTEAKEAVNETARAARSSLRGTFAAVRDNEEVVRLRQGSREFLRKVEDPALIMTTAINPPLGLGLTGVVKGSRLVARGLRAEARIAARQDSSDSE